MIIQDDNGLEHAYTIHIRCKRQKYSCVHFLCSIKSTALLWPWCPRDTVPPPPHPEMYSTFLPERRPCHNIQCTEFKNTLSFDATIETFQVFVWKLGRNFLWNSTVRCSKPKPARRNPIPSRGATSISDGGYVLTNVCEHRSSVGGVQWFF